MRLITIVLAITAISTNKYTENYGCSEYKQALFQYGNPWTTYSQNNSARYYSQAPAGKSLGKCNQVPCVGSPIFLIEKAHDWID